MLVALAALSCRGSTHRVAEVDSEAAAKDAASTEKRREPDRTTLDDRARRRRLAALMSSDRPETIEAATRDVDAHIRGEAAYRLGKTAHPAALELLRRLARDPSPVTRALVVQGLAQLPDQRGIPTIIELAVGDSSEMVRDQAVWALGVAGGAEARTALETLARDSVEIVAKDAQHVLTAHQRDPKSDQAMAAREAAVLSGSGVQRRERLRALIRSESSEEATHTLAAAIHDPDPVFRAAAAYLLGSTNSPRALTLLRLLSSDPFPVTRAAVVEGLDELPEQKGLPLILEFAVGDPFEDVRGEAVSALADAEGDAARKALERLSHDPVEVVARRARAALARRH